MGLLAGIIEGGLQGGAQAVQGMAQQGIAEQQKAELAQQLSDQELAKMKAAAVFNAEQQSNLRQAQVARIDAAMPGIVDKQIAAQYPSLPGAEDGGDNGLRNAQDANAGAARAQLMGDWKTRIQAGESTGDVPLGTAGALFQRSDATAAQLQWRLDHNDVLASNNANTNASRESIAANHDDTRAQIAAERESRLSAAKDASVAALAQSVRLNVAEMNNNRIMLKTAQDNLLLNPNDPDAKAEVKRLHDNIAALDGETQQYKAILNDKVGVKAHASAPTPAPAPAASAAKTVDWHDLK